MGGRDLPDLPEESRKRGADYRVDDATGCWVWQKSLVTGGYGRIQKNDGTRFRAHRVYYEKHVGPIPDGFEVHHTCGNRRCVNPEHLEAVAPSEHRNHHGKWSNHLGVTYAKNDGLWMARIKREGVRRVLGFFKTEAEAATAIKEAGGYGA